MKCIVTGGSGFLGTHLVRALLQEGHQVKNIDLRESPDVATTIADIRNKEAMLAEIIDADCVFHLAALIEAGESVKNPQSFIDTNITGTLNVLEAMRQNNIKLFIFSSTAAVYGEPLSIPISEDDRTIPINPYGMTKLAIEGLLSSYVASYDFTGVALRYFNLYGPEEHHEPETHAIPRFIKQLYNNEEITVWGSGEHQRDYIHISDVVDAHLKALDFAQAQPKEYHYFNLSTEQPASVLEIVGHITQAFADLNIQREPKITHFPARAGDPLKLYASSQKARHSLSWTPRITLEAGMREVVEYFLTDWQKDKQ